MNKVDNAQGHSLRELFTQGKAFLCASGIEEADAEADARLLLEHAAKIDRSYYYLHMEEPIDDDAAEAYREMLHRRAQREPVQYITGEAFFYGNTYYVTPDVLIPRQDTEILVAEAEKRLKPGMHILDLCTGSGCVLLSILQRCAAAGTGSDISEAALHVAEQNGKRLGVAAEWIRSDLFAGIGGVFDIIVGNPPYIRSEVLQDLQPEVISHEPVTALDGGKDGLDILRRIIREAPDHLQEDGWILLEIGYDQGDAVRSLLTEQGYNDIQIIKDLEHRERVAAGRRPQGCRSRLKN